MSWRTAVENEQRVITLIQINDVYVSDSNEGILTTEYNQSPSETLSGQPFGRAAFGGMGGAILDTVTHRKKHNPYLSVSPIQEMNMEGRSSFGSVEITNADGFFWFLQPTDPIPGRKAVVYLGAENDHIHDFERILQADIETFQFTDRLERLVLTLKDLSDELLNQPIQERAYTGEGGEDGDSNIEGDLKPLFLGKTRVNDLAIRQPKLVNAVRLIYQVNDGPTADNLKVYDAGAPLTRDTAFDPESDNLFLYQPAQGEYAYDQNSGLLRIGASPVGVLTVARGERVDFGGQSETGTFQEIIRGILEHSGLGTDLLDATSLDRIGNDDNDFWVKPEFFVDCTNLSVLDVIDQLCEWTYSFWFFNQHGKLYFYEKTHPDWDTSIPEVSLQESDIIAIDLIETLENSPVWRWVVRRYPHFYVHSESDMAESIKDTLHSNFISREFRVRNESKDVFLQERNKLALSQELDTGIMFIDSAETPGVDSGQVYTRRLLSITKERRIMRANFVLTAKHLFTLTPGMIIENNYAHDLLDIGNGERLQISSVRNDLNAMRVYVEAIW